MKNIPTAQLIEVVKSALQGLPSSPPGGARDQFDELVRRIDATPGNFAATPANLSFYVVTDLPNGETVLSPTSAAWIDGCFVGDRLLDNILFKITVDENGAIHAQFHDDPSYNLEGLDLDYWRKHAAESASVCDIFSSDPASEGDPQEIVLYDRSKPHTQQAANFDKMPLFQ